MKSTFFKSLRWRLQVWHTIVLLIVISSFGAIVHRLHWQTRLQQVDADLVRSLSVVGWQMRRLMPRPPGRRPPRRRDEERREGEPADRIDDNQPARPEPPRGEPDPNGPPDMPLPRDRVLSESDSASSMPEFEQFFHGDEDARMYFVIWNDKGEVLLKSESAPEVDFPNLHNGSEGVLLRNIRERHADHIYREAIQAGPFRGARNLLVGRSIDRVLADHHQSGVLLIVTGLVILAAGMIGGGWLAGRAIRPIATMTTAAESISAQNLSKRIDVSETDSELGNLANVLNRTFDRLQSAFERQQQFTADASHELRTPLSVIMTHSELALSRPRSNEDYQLAIKTCQQAAKRMRTLIDALLVLARFDSGTPVLRHDSLDLEPLIQDCVELVTPLANDRKITLECQTAPCTIHADWDRLSQVFTNLLSNAIRYNKEGGQVRISTRTEPDHVVISVTDTGIGIAADELPRIFDRFYQVDKARSRAEGSCGLGLSICKTIVDAHGGSIVASSQIDVGTTIEVRLPNERHQVLSDQLASRSDILVSSGHAT